MYMDPSPPPPLPNLHACVQVRSHMSDMIFTPMLSMTVVPYEPCWLSGGVHAWPEPCCSTSDSNSTRLLLIRCQHTCVWLASICSTRVLPDLGIPTMNTAVLSCSPDVTNGVLNRLLICCRFRCSFRRSWLTCAAIMRLPVWR